MRRKYVSQAELNHKKYGSKWKLAKAKKFFKAVIGTDKFVINEPSGVGDTIFYFCNDHIRLQAYVGYGSTRIELQTINPSHTIGYYDFVTFEMDRDYTWKEHDRHWEAVKKEIIYNQLDWLHSLSQQNTPRFAQEIQKIKDYEF